MLTRLTLAGGAVTASLAFAAPALASPGSLFGHVRPLHQARPLTQSAKAAAKAKKVTLYVNGTTGSDGNPCTQALPCQTISYAVQAAPAVATIKVAAGTYPEQVDVASKDLTIIGAGATKTTIAPTTTTDSVDFSGIDADVMFESTTGGAIENLTVDGSAGYASDADNCGDIYAGVAFMNAGGTLSGVKVDAAGPAALVSGTCVSAVGGFVDDLGAMSGSGPASGDGLSVTAKTSTFTGYGIAGFACGDEACAVSGSKVIGPGTEDLTPGYGIDLYEDPTASVTTTTVSGNTFADEPGETPGSAGVAAYDVGGLSITHSTFTHNDTDIAAINDQVDPPANAWTISHDKALDATDIAGNQSSTRPPLGLDGVGIALVGATEATVTSNTVTGNADLGIMLDGSEFATVGLAGAGNTVTSNGYDGIWVGSNTPGGGFPGYDPNGQPSTINVVQDNTVKGSGVDGIYVEGTDSNGNPQAEDNLFQTNTLTTNGLFGAEDDSTGGDTAGTANNWTGNVCTPAGDSSPSGLCS